MPALPLPSTAFPATPTTEQTASNAMMASMFREIPLALPVELDVSPVLLQLFAPRLLQGISL